MSFRRNVLSIVLLPALLLGCGGGDDFSFGNGTGNFNGGGSDSGGGTDSGSESSGTDADTTNISYLPLSVYERYKAFSGFSSDNLFQTDGQYPLIPAYIINPINATTLETLDTAVATDYKVTIDGVEIDNDESFPLLQKVVGTSVQLNTAIVFDTSNSMKLSTAEYDALKTEAKNYIDKVRAHSDPQIASQRFVVWSFDEDATDLTSGFASNDTDIKAAIDSISRNIGSSSNLHKSMVKVIGRYVDDDDASLDFSIDGDNDLVDFVQMDNIELSQVVLFSSGTDSKLEFEQEKMIQAIESQGFLSYEPLDPSETSSDSLTDNYTKKPVFYYVTGGSSEGTAYQALSEVAESTESITPVEGAFTFSDGLIDKQISAIDKRIDLEKLYVYRYAFLPRQGDHTEVFSSKSENNNYSLTVKWTAEYFTDLNLTNLGTPYQELVSLVEITGPNDEYLANQQANFTDLQTFRAATRWTDEQFLGTDYSWTITGGTGTTNADGSYTIDSLTSTPASLQVTNTVNGQVSSITITN